MRALVHDQSGRTEVGDVARPTAGPGEVLLRVAAAGLCGTDRHIAEGSHGSAGRGIVIGHEVSGVIEQAGAGVDHLDVGTVVCVEPNVACGWCATCRAGHANLCPNLQAVGVTRDGGLASHLVVPASLCHPVPTGLSARDAVLGEPLSCVVRALSSVNPKPGSSAAVWGLGTAGLMMIQYLRAAGASRIVAVSHHASHRERALAAGATEALTQEDAAGGLSVDLAVEASGSPTAFVPAFEAVAPRGTLLIYGVMSPEDRVPIAPERMFRHEMSIKGSYVGLGAIDTALTLLASRAVDPDIILGDAVDLAQAADWVHRRGARQEAKTYVPFS